MEVNDCFESAVVTITLNVVKKRKVPTSIIFTYIVSVSERLISEKELGGIRRKKVNESRRHNKSLDGQKAVILQSGM